MLNTVYYVDPQGKFLGGFCGVVVERPIKRTESRQVEKARAPDADPAAPAEFQEVHVEVDDFEEVTVMPELPDGALIINEPPEHGNDVLISFKTVDGKAMGGTWDTVARPKPPKPLEARIADALVLVGIMDSKQAEIFISSFQ